MSCCQSKDTSYNHSHHICYYTVSVLTPRYNTKRCLGNLLHLKVTAGFATTPK